MSMVLRELDYNPYISIGCKSPKQVTTQLTELPQFHGSNRSRTVASVASPKAWAEEWQAEDFFALAKLKP